MRGFEYSLIDDSSNVYSNRFICNLRSQNIGYLWRHPYYDLYMPITDTIWAFLARISPLKTPLYTIIGNDPTVLNPAVFHTASVVIHLLTTTIVYGIARRLRFVPWASAAGALVFAVHPLQVESVAWITGMNNLICGLFAFLAVYLYILQVPEKTDQPNPSRLAPLMLTVATFAFIAALLSKPLATIVPVMIVVLETSVFRRPWRRWVAPVAGWFLLSLLGVMVTHAASSDTDFRGLSAVWQRPFIAGDALAFYLVKLFFPYELTFDYGRNPHNVLTQWWGYVTWILPAAVCAALWSIGRPAEQYSLSLARSLSWLRTGILIFFAALLPTLGLVPFYSEAISTVSDRFAYLAMLGPALAVAALLSRPAPTPRLLMAVPVAILASLAYLSALDVPIWKDRYSLTNDMLAATPNSGMAHQCYGIILGQRGKWEESLVEFRKAASLESVVPPAIDDSIGQSLYHLNRFDEAIAHYKEAIRIQPDDNDAWFQLWLVYSRLNRMKEAEAYVLSHIAKHPYDDRAKFTLGLILMQENRPADALPYIELAAKNDPESSDDQYYVGVIEQKLGRLSEAAACYKRALELDPTNADAHKAQATLPPGIVTP